MARTYYDHDADPAALDGKTVAVVGYGNQGRAQALNLRDGGARVIVGVRADETRALAASDGFDVSSIGDAASRGDVVMMLIPDEVMPEVFEGEIRAGLATGKALCFASGYAVAFATVVPPEDVDVILVAPRMIGAGVRDRYVSGSGFPTFVGVHQDATGHALRTTLAIARGIGSTRVGALELTFAQEAALDLFTEQAFGPAFGQVLVSAIQTLVDAGYPPEAAMMELILSGEFAYSMQKIVELGFFRQMDLHSHTSQYGSLSRGIRFVNPDLMTSMRAVLDEIRSGAFAREWEDERRSGLTTFEMLREMRSQHPIADWERRTRDAFRMDEPSAKKG